MCVHVFVRVRACVRSFVPACVCVGGCYSSYERVFIRSQKLENHKNLKVRQCRPSRAFWVLSSRLGGIYPLSFELFVATVHDSR